MEKKKNIEDLNDLLVKVRALCSISNNSNSIKVKEDSSFVLNFYELVFLLFTFLSKNFNFKENEAKLEEKSETELITFLNDLNLFFMENYFIGSSSETWIKSIMLLYGTLSYYKAILMINQNILLDFELGNAIENLEMTIYENASYENLLYLEKKQLFFMKLNERRRKRK